MWCDQESELQQRQQRGSWSCWCVRGCGWCPPAAHVGGWRSSVGMSCDLESERQQRRQQRGSWSCWCVRGCGWCPPAAHVGGWRSRAGMWCDQESERQQRQQCGSWSCRSEEHTSELQSLMRISYAVFCLTKKKTITNAS